jgi:meso-butanediol dehydrogenase/(S,S)-butanediol dehydrogenase/diacetyl reductase
MGRVEGKVVIVTGAAQGMGRAIAHTLVKEGAKVVFADMNEAGAKEAAQAAADAFSGEAMGLALDVRSREQTAAVIKAAVDAWGRLDVMFNNAGVNRPQKFLETTKENWDFIMDINAWGVMVGMQEAAKQMIEQGRKGELAGKIINTGSIVGKAGLDPNVVPYSVSKYGVAAMTEMGAREFAAHDITVNSYAPGVVDTPLWETLDEQLMELGVSEKKGQAMKDFSAGILRGRAATPADIVGTALYLASSDSDYMTGQTIMIDGGMVFT